jgi:HK97 family phage prohead protease
MQRVEVKFAAGDIDGKTGEFSGYGAIFGNVDAYGDVIAPGAFKGTLRDWRAQKKLPPMLLQHGGWGMTDSDGIPIGVWSEMAEDEAGLAVKGRLINLDTDRGRQVYGAMKEGVLDGLSIGYRAKKFTMGTKPEEPRRRLEAVDLMEVSVVTFPANGQARVRAVKAAGELMTIREFEDFLRDAGGFSREAARAIAATGFKSVAQPRDEGASVDDLAEMLRRNINTIKKGVLND